MATWAPPEPVPASAGRYPLVATVEPGGEARVALFGPLAIIPGNPQAPVSVTTGAPAFGAPAPVPHGLASPVAVSPDGATMLAVGGPRSPLDPFQLEGGTPVRVRVGIGPSTGRLRLVATRGLAATQTLASAVNDRGDAAVVVSRCLTRGCSRRTLLAAFRRRGGAFGRPLVLSRVTSRHPAAAVTLNAAGDALVAWNQSRAGHLPQVRVRRHDHDGALTPVRVAGSTTAAPTLAVTLTRGGLGSVAWFGQPVAEGGDGGPYEVAARELGSRGDLHGLAVLDRGSSEQPGDGDAIGGARLRAVLGPDGAPTYAWTAFSGGHYVVRAIRLHRQVGAVETLSPPGVDGELEDLAADPAGDALAVWRVRPAPGAITSATAANLRLGAAATFRPAETVSATVGGTAAAAVAGAFGAVVAFAGTEVGGSQAPTYVSRRVATLP